MVGVECERCTICLKSVFITYTLKTSAPHAPLPPRTKGAHTTLLLSSTPLAHTAHLVQTPKSHHIAIVSDRAKRLNARCAATPSASAGEPALPTLLVGEQSLDGALEGEEAVVDPPPLLPCPIVVSLGSAAARKQSNVSSPS